MWLILAEPFDAAALWVYKELRARKLTPLEFVTAEALLRAQTWEHRLGTDGVSLRIRLADGRTIDNENVRGVLNRLTYIDQRFFRAAPPDERNYATQEMTALFISWLAALPCPVLNRGCAQGLSGSWRHQSEWTHLAARAGLATRPFRHDSHDTSFDLHSPQGIESYTNFDCTVLVVEDQLVSPRSVSLPPEVIAACVRLGSLARTELLGVRLRCDGTWTFLSATPQADLRAGGAALLDVLQTVFTHREGKRGASQAEQNISITERMAYP